jgi:mono/diheme cytochrome c family protein
MRLRFSLSGTLLLFAIGLLCAADRLWAVKQQAEISRQTKAFFSRHCLECHDADTKKGGLNLDGVDGSIVGAEQADLWTRIYDRVAKGEMPPAKKARPPRAEIDALLTAVKPSLVEADRKRREVVQRRLNREEYQNTIHDLLAVDIDLKGLLPADQQAGGFDNNGEALAVSTEQMQCYLEAARLAIDAATLVGQKPKTETFKVDPSIELRKAIENGDFGYEDGRVIISVTDKGDYSKIATRAHRVPVRGRYRIRFQAAAANTQELQFFTITASNFSAFGPNSKNLGYFDVGPQPKRFEIEALIDEKCAVQFFVFGLPTWIKPERGSKHPGVGFGEVEFTGPLIDRWPPVSYTRLLGDVKLASGTLDDAQKILRGFLPRAFRRPVEDAEVQRYVALVRSRLDAGRGFSESIRAGLVAVLCSPNFLYMREDVRPDSSRVSDTELASRLSYFFWTTMPDQELLDLAAGGQLHDPKILHAQVERMLKDSKSAAFVSDFTGQWLRLRQINDTTPDEKLYGKFDELLRISMMRESEEFFRQLIVDDLPIDNILDSNWAMLNQRLAQHYGIKGVSGIEMRKVTLPPESVRGGVLTQAAVLKVTANGTTTSPVLRGVWVLENILGDATPPPPPNVGGIEPDIRGATTVREQLDKHRKLASCSVCHQKIDPPGFALESFDPIGDYRENYLRWKVTNEETGWGNVIQGAKVDASGKLATGEAFGDIREFKKLLMERRGDFAHCLTEKLLTYGLGREMGFSDREPVAAIIRQAEEHGSGLRTLIHAIAESETFATR